MTFHLANPYRLAMAAASQAGQSLLGWFDGPTGSVTAPGRYQGKMVAIIVVYKIDRLKRSLSDFAKLVGLFDSHGVSFGR
jgi:hypothetical protein